MATAREQYKEQKVDGVRFGKWLKWARLKFLPARGKPTPERGE
jgi:hypothetical protein